MDATEGEPEQLRAQIIAARLRLQSLIESLTENFDDLTEAADLSPPDDEHDPEGHTIALERSRLTGQRDEYRKAIVALNAAEANLDDPHFAQCAECGETIPLERLLAVPTTSHCVRCVQSRPGRPTRRPLTGR